MLCSSAAALLTIPAVVRWHSCLIVSALGAEKTGLSMGELQTLHKTARSLILSLREGVEQLERAEQVDAGQLSWMACPFDTASHQKPCCAQVNHQYAQATGLAQQLRGRLLDLQRVSQQLDGVWRMQALRDSGTKTDMWKRKVEQVSEEADDLSAALDKHTHRVRR